jgi:hypothetical protein
VKQPRPILRQSSSQQLYEDYIKNQSKSKDSARRIIENSGAVAKKRVIERSKLRVESEERQPVSILNRHSSLSAGYPQ